MQGLSLKLLMGARWQSSLLQVAIGLTAPEGRSILTIMIDMLERHR